MFTVSRSATMIKSQANKSVQEVKGQVTVVLIRVHLVKSQPVTIDTVIQ